MKKISLGHWRWLVVVLSMLVLTHMASIFGIQNAKMAKGSNNRRTVTIWIQGTDSCATALPNISLAVSGPGLSPNTQITTGGSHAQTIPTYTHASRRQKHCPWDRRTCVNFSTGCASLVLPVPATGVATYTITPKAIGGRHYLNGIVLLPKKPAGRNYAYVWCEGGSDCRYGPEVGTIRITPNGSVSARTQNTNPDGFKDLPWVSAGTRSNPLIFSFFGASAPNDFAMTCLNDRTHRLRDHMTGTPLWAHCNSGR